MSTAYEDIAFAPRNYGLSEEEVDKRVTQALEMVGITYLKDKQIYKMSGGEKKLVSIATILSMTPDIILMDEPSIALDPRNRRNLIHILNSLDKLKIITSHDLDMILDTCERTILMSEGKIIRDGDTREILSDKELLEANGLELPLSLMR
jgi:cobalt/nickel transport system ATP-binding protein